MHPIGVHVHILRNLSCQTSLSLNLLSKRVLSLILEKHLVVLESFPASLKILELKKKISLKNY